MNKTIKVLYTTRYTRRSSHAVPRIQLEGKWLEELGFKVGDNISVEYENGAIHIRTLQDETQPALGLVAENHPAFKGQ